jgi:hypothetical protein
MSPAGRQGLEGPQLVERANKAESRADWKVPTGRYTRRASCNMASGSSTKQMVVTINA